MIGRGRPAAGAVAAALLTACSSPGAMLRPAPAGLAPRPPAAVASDVALVIYSHGSREEFLADRCAPRGDTTPSVVRDLVGARIAGFRLAVYADCTPTRRGDFVAAQHAGAPKVEERAADLERLIERFWAAGLPPQRIVLMGHSAGAWASLWTARDADPPVAGVIAVAPAFAGPARTRSAGWRWLREVHERELAASRRLPALVFAFRDDAFETPQTLSFLERIPGVDLVAVPPAGADPPACAGATAHRAIFTPCFEREQQARIRAFLAHVLVPGGVAPAAAAGQDARRAARPEP